MRIPVQLRPDWQTAPCPCSPAQRAGSGCCRWLSAAAGLASVDKGIRGFSRGKTTPGYVILVGGRQPTCLVCLASRRLSAAKNSEGLAGTAGALPARQRTQACWRKSRTITQPAACQSVRWACVPLSADAMIVINEIRENSK